MRKVLQNVGIEVLENRVVQWNDIQIVGLNHMIPDENFAKTLGIKNIYTIKSILSKLTIINHKPSILLHHSPDGIKYANQSGVDLYLSGHTHAGQLFPIKYIAKMMFSYNQGLHQYKDTKLIVSQGVGTFGPPMRIGTQSEIIVLNLTPEQ